MRSRICDRGSQPTQLASLLSRRVARDVFHGVGGQRGVDGDVGGAGTEAGVVGQGPFEPRLSENRHVVTRRDAELAQTQRDRPHPLQRVPVRHRLPHAGRLVAKRSWVSGVALDGAEQQLGERARAHGRNLTTKVSGEPGTAVRTARRAVAVTSTVSGTGPRSKRTLTVAIPRAAVATVSTVSPEACAASRLTSLTEPR